MTTAYDFHEVASIFPMMDGFDLESLKDDIAAHGLREPLWLHDGKIIDGRNRYLACQVLDIEPAVREWDGEGYLLDFVVSLNLHRRHLTESQRAMIGARVKERFEADAKQRQRGGQGGILLPANLPEANRGESREKAAALVNVSPRSVEAASKVQENGIPELGGAVDRGEVSVSAAAAVATLPEPEQAEVVARGPAAVKEAAGAIRRARKPAPSRSTAMEDDTPAYEEESQEEAEEEAESPEDGDIPHTNGFVLSPPPVTHAEKCGESWARIISEFAYLVNTIRRRHGMKALAQSWPDDKLDLAEGVCGEVIEAFTQYRNDIRELRACLAKT